MDELQQQSSEADMEDGELVEEEDLTERQSPTATAPVKKESKPEEKPKDEIKDFIEKKKMELAERLKSQLASIGVKSQLDSDSEPDEPKAKSISKRSTTSAAPGVIEEKVKKSPTPRYYDYDKSNNATEEMISNWAKGSRSAVRTDKYKSESKRQGPASPVPPDFLNIKSSDYDEMDPYADYYGTSESPSEPTSNVVGTSQPDYHVSPVGDVDYRNGQKSTAYFSGSEDSNYSESSKPVDNNSHGDIDERHSRQHGKRKSSSTRKSADSSKKRSKRRRTSASGSSGNDSGSDSESESRRRRSDRSRPSDSSRVRSRTTKGSGSRGSYSPVPTSRASRGKFERGGRGFVPRVRERDSKDRPICRFYKEGYCREGTTCPYSHQCEVVQYPGRFGGKKPELCKYYMNGFCRNEGRCPFYHEDWPCRAFHKGDCIKGTDCRYSHSPLTDVTRPLFERMCREESPPKLEPPEPVSRRKTLLGAPPGPNGPQMQQPFQPNQQPNFNAMMPTQNPQGNDQFRPILGDQNGPDGQMSLNGDFPPQQQVNNNFPMNLGNDPSIQQQMAMMQPQPDGPVAPWHIQNPNNISMMNQPQMQQQGGFGLNPYGANMGAAGPQGFYNDFNMQMRPQMGGFNQPFQPQMQMGMAMGNNNGQFDSQQQQQQQQFFNMQMQQQMFNQQQQQMQMAQQLQQQQITQPDNNGQPDQQQQQQQQQPQLLQERNSPNTDRISPESHQDVSSAQQKVFDRIRNRQKDNERPASADSKPFESALGDKDERLQSANSPDPTPGETTKQPAFSITDILKQIKQNVSGGLSDTQPSAYQSAPYSRLVKPARRPGDYVDWRFLEVFVPYVSPEDKVPKSVMQMSLTEPKLRNDPRIKRRLDSQFDIGTQQLISQMQQQQKGPLPLESPASPQPESSGNDNFPFNSPSGYQPSLSQSQQQQITTGGATDPRSLHRDPRLSGKVPVGNNLPIPNVPVQQQMPMGMLMGPPQQLGLPMGNFGPMASGNGPMPLQQNMMAPMGVNGWMPQLAMGNGQMPTGFGPSLPDISISQMAQMGQQQQQQMPTNNFNPGRSQMPPERSFGRNFDTRPQQPYDRSRDEPQLPWAKSSSPSTTNDSESLPNTNETSGNGSPGSYQSAVSLREKRKDLQYESPLAPKEKLSGSQYNKMPNVRVKRKTSGSDSSPLPPPVPVESPM